MNATSLGISCPFWSGRRVTAMPKVFVRLLSSPSSYCLLPAYMLRHFSHARLFLTPWTVACHVSLSIGFSRQEYWSMLPCPPAGDLPDPGVEPVSLVYPALAGGFFTISDTFFFFFFFCSVVSDSLWPHGLQPTRPLCPWDSPGKNTGVGCYFLLHLGIPFNQLHAVLSRSVVSNYDGMDCRLPSSSVLGVSPGKNIGVGFHALLQGIFTNQRSKPSLLHCRLYSNIYIYF